MRRIDKRISGTLVGLLVLTVLSSAAQARYIQADPMGLAAGPNLYSYAGQNPTQWIDPLGLAVKIVIQRDVSNANGQMGTITVTSDQAGAGAFVGQTIENPAPGDHPGPIDPATYSAFVRADHDPNRIELNNVPGFTHVQIHTGNTTDDVEGCFAAGTTRGNSRVNGSRDAMNQINQVIQNDGTGDITVIVIAPRSPDPSLPATPLQTPVNWSAPQQSPAPW